MQFFDVGIAIETEDTDFTVGDTVLFMNPCNISGMIHWFHTVTRYTDSKIRLFRCEMTDIVTFFYTVFNIIWSNGKNVSIAARRCRRKKRSAPRAGRA